MSIKIGIYGYGNLAKGVELAVKANPDMELAAVFTRRDPSTVKIATEGAVVAFDRRQRARTRNVRFSADRRNF